MPKTMFTHLVVEGNIFKNGTNLTRKFSSNCALDFGAKRLSPALYFWLQPKYGRWKILKYCSS